MSEEIKNPVNVESDNSTSKWHDIAEVYKDWHPELHPHVERILEEQGITVVDNRALEDWNAVSSDSEEPFDASSYASAAQAWIDAVNENLNVKIHLETEDIEELIEAGYGETLLEHCDKLEHEEKTTIASYLMVAGRHDIVASNLAELRGLPARTCFMLLTKFYGDAVVNHLDSFVDVRPEDVAFFLLRQLETEVLASNIDKFSGIDLDDLFTRLLNTNHLADLLDAVHYFEGFDHNYVAQKLLDNKKFSDFERHLGRFSGLNQSIANQLINEGHVYLVGKYITSFSGIDLDNLADTLINEGFAKFVVRHLDLYDSVDRNQLAETLLEIGDCETIIHNLDYFPDINFLQLVDVMIKNHRSYLVVDYIDKMSGVDRIEVAYKLASAGGMRYVLEKLGRFKDLNMPQFLEHFLDESLSILQNENMKDVLDLIKASPEEYSFLEKYAPLFLEDGNDEYLEGAFITYQKMYSLTGLKESSILAKQKDYFGTNGTLATAKALQQLLNDAPLSEELKAFGITSTGVNGIEQMQALVRELRQKILSGDLDHTTEKYIEQSDIARSVFMQTTEYLKKAGTKFGERGEAQLRQKITYRNNALEDGLISPMPNEYAPSKVYTIATAKHEKQQDPWTTDVLERYTILRSEVEKAVQIACTRFNGFGEAISQLRDKIELLERNITEQIDAIDPAHPKATHRLENLERRRQSLAKYLETVKNPDEKTRRFIMDSPADFQRGFMELEQYPELHSDIRTLTFAWAFRKNPQEMNKMGRLNRESPTINDMTSMREFIERVVSKDTFGNHFSDIKTAEKFRRMSSTVALEQGIKRYTGQSSNMHQTELQFVPTRSILLEISGEIADACWADRYECIGEDMPNISAIIMRARPHAANERIVGAALLIETTDVESGEGVLVLRGTNPSENYINKVSAKSFYDAITDYVRELAEARGLKPAVVIDEDSGDAGTNRPALSGVMFDESRDMKNIHVAQDSEFNDLKISHRTFAL